MAILINMKPQRPVETVDAASQSIPCGLAKVQRTSTARERKPRRVVACPAKPAPTTTSVLKSEDIPLWVPPTGRSAYHRRLELDARTSMQQLLAQHEISAQMRRTDNGTGSTTPDVEFDPQLNDLAYSLIADIVTIAGHLMDKVDVTAESYLKEKLMAKTSGYILALAERLRKYGMTGALQALQHAVEPKPFVEFLSAQPAQNTTRAVYDRINLNAGHLLLAMLEIALHAPDVDVDDWPDPGPDAGPGIAPAEPQSVPAAAAIVRGSGKRAKRVGRKTASPRRKR